MFHSHWYSGNNAKKMHPKTKTPRRIADEEIRKDGMAKALAYTPPVYRENKGGCYIEFYAYNPETGKLERKRTKVNHVQGKLKRKQYANEAIRRLSDQLSTGWNPWIHCDPDNLVSMEDALDKYEEIIMKSLSNGIFRKQTYDDYKSKIKILRNYIKKYNPIRYVYQFKKKFCIGFLDYVYLERNNGAQTYNNYLNFLRVLAGWLLERGYITEKVTDGISPISKRLIQKERTCIPLDKVRDIGEWTKSNDPYFHFACLILYYCFVRPVEMTRIRIGDFDLQKGTLTLHEDQTKNRQTQTVTVPKKLLYYAIDLGVFSAPMGDYVFSTRLRPGKIQIDTKIFRDHWAKVSRALKLKKEWKFYSLKDTGLTEMLEHDVAAPVQVKNQARHSSLAITEIYLSKIPKAIPEILEHEGSL